MSFSKSVTFPISQQKRNIILLGIGIILLILIIPGFVHNFSSNMLISSRMEQSDKTKNDKFFEVPSNLPIFPKKSEDSDLISSYLYGNLDIIDYIPIILNNEQLIIVGSQKTSESNLFIVNFQNQQYHEYSTSTTDYIKYASVSDTDFDNTIFVTGNRQSLARQSVFFTSIDSQELNKIYLDGEISVGDNCWVKEMVQLSTGNFLLLVQSISGINSTFWLYEIEPFTGSIVHQKSFPFTASSILAEIDHDNFKYIHLFDDDTILLVGHNCSTDDAGISIYLGSLEGNWLNKSISGDLELQMMDVARDGTIYMAYEYSNLATGNDDLDIIHFSSNLEILDNATLSSSGYSYHLLDFCLNHEINNMKPFLLYSILDDSSYPGYGFAFVDGSNFLQKSEENPSNTEMKSFGTIKFLSNGDACFGKNTIIDSYGYITIYRISESTTYSYQISEFTFTQFALPSIIGENPSDGSILVNIYDFAHSGVYIFSSTLSSKDSEIILEDDQVCQAYYLHSENDDKIIFYGYQGDYFNNHGKALLLEYSITGILLKSAIRDDSSEYSESWNWISVLPDILYLVGMQTNTFESSQNTLILGKVNFEDLFSAYRYVSNIAIYDHDQIQSYIDIGVISGTGTEIDPYIMDHLRIDGNREDTSNNAPGINIYYNAYFEISNCIIENLNMYNSVGIFITEMSFVKIISNNISHCFKGIELVNVNNATIYNNTISDSMSMGILLLKNYDGGGSNGNHIFYNTITHTQNSGEEWSGNGISVISGHYNIIDHNTITDNVNFGIYLDNAWEDIEEPQVTNTRIYENDLSSNSAPYNPNLSKELGNRFWNNTGAEDFPSSEFDSIMENIPGYSLTVISGAIFFSISYLVRKKKEKSQIF
ncbi:Loki-CTERM sorting domain-containing protein [Candidatus Harpocratesius sp.]